MPDVKPTVIVRGMYFISAPRRRSPIIISIPPAIRVAMARPSTPYPATMPATMVAKAAVGPEMLTRLPPRRDITKPAKTAVYKPRSGETPDAIARAMERGRAIIATIIPAMMSDTSCFFE
jgi:hypothetical protein